MDKQVKAGSKIVKFFWWLFKGLISWLFFGGPQRKPGTPQKTLVFRLLYFLTATPIWVVLFLYLVYGDLTKLDSDKLKIVFTAIGVFIVAIFMWGLRLKISSISKKPDLLEEEKEDKKEDKKDSNRSESRDEGKEDEKDSNKAESKDESESDKNEQAAADLNKAPCPLCGEMTDAVQACPRCGKVYSCYSSFDAGQEHLKDCPQFCSECGTKLYEDAENRSSSNHLQNYKWSSTAMEEYKKNNGHVLDNNKLGK